MPATYEPIASHTVGSAVQSVSFTNVPGNFTDLVISVSNTKHSFTGGGAVADIGLQFNADTANNYSSIDLQGNGVVLNSGIVPNTSGIFTFWPRVSDQPGQWLSHVMSYANTSVNKTVLTSAASVGGRVGRLVGLWRSTSAITRVDVTVSAGYTMSAGTVIGIYGIKAA